MAQKVLVEMVDDIDGGTAAQTVQFALDGVSYEIDLSDGNANNLRSELANFVEAARRTGGRKVRSAPGQAAAAPRTDRTRQIREWARENGYAISARGRIAAEITQAYEEAQRQPAPEPARKKTTRKTAAAKKTTRRSK
jgi:Lsr2